MREMRSEGRLGTAAAEWLDLFTLAISRAGGLFSWDISCAGYSLR